MRNEGRGSRVSFVGGTVIVALIGVMAVVLVMSSLGRGGEAAASAPTPSPSATQAPARDDSDSTCGLDGYEDTSTLTGAPVVDWSIVGTMAAPASEAAGPGLTDADGLRRCYARTAEGALLAAANIAAMGTDSLLGPLMTEKLVVDGPGRDAALAQGTNGRSTGGVSPQIAGFKILSYSPDRAAIDIAFQLSTGQMISLPQVLEWDDGDWKVVLNASGQLTLTSSPLRSLGGYTPWAGIS